MSKIIIGSAALFAMLVIGASALGFVWNLLQLQTLKAIGGFIALKGHIASTIAYLRVKNAALMLTNARLTMATLTTRAYGLATLGLSKALAFGAVAIKGVGVALIGIVVRSFVAFGNNY